MVALQDQLAKTPFAMISATESPRTNRIKNPLPRGHTYSFRLIKESRDVSAARKARDVIFASRRQKNRKRRARAVIPPPGSPGGDQTTSKPKRLFC